MPPIAVGNELKFAAANLSCKTLLRTISSTRSAKSAASADVSQLQIMVRESVHLDLDQEIAGTHFWAAASNHLDHDFPFRFSLHEQA